MSFLHEKPVKVERFARREWNGMLHDPWIKLKARLDPEDRRRIGGLEQACAGADGTTLKLELDYKLGATRSGPDSIAPDINELMYFDGDRLVGYLGIGCFGGASAPPEAMGMVHPDFRKRGVFGKLHTLAMAELKRRGVPAVLLLSDGKSVSGRAFIRKIGAVPHHSEYEMYLRGWCESSVRLDMGVTFRKALNADASEILRQNGIYFGEDRGSGEEGLLMPEEEEKRGMTIFLAEKDGQVIGKVHLQLAGGLGGIYGLGVLPEYRGRGFGRAILQDAVRRLKEAGAAEVMLQVATGNQSALRLYESCGFVTTSTMEYSALTL